jgi:hypothetical protein
LLNSALQAASPVVAVVLGSAMTAIVQIKPDVFTDDSD